MKSSFARPPWIAFPTRPVSSGLAKNSGNRVTTVIRMERSRRLGVDLEEARERDYADDDLAIRTLFYALDERVRVGDEDLASLPHSEQGLGAVMLNRAHPSELPIFADDHGAIELVDLVREAARQIARIDEELGAAIVLRSIALADLADVYRGRDGRHPAHRSQGHGRERPGDDESDDTVGSFVFV